MDRGFKVGLVTDGPSRGGMIAKIQKGDQITISGSGVLQLHASVHDGHAALCPSYLALRKTLAGTAEGASSIFTYNNSRKQA